MAESDGGWGTLEDDESREQWDSFALLPEPDTNAALDSFCVRKNITIDALRRIGTRLSDDHVLAFAYPDGIKYRDLVSDKRWSNIGVEWKHLKIVPAGPEPAATVIVAEGESDAARLTLLLPDFDVALLPAGAKQWTTTFSEQLKDYSRVLAGHDKDSAGNAGAAKLLASVPQAVRYEPSGNDWCSSDELPPLPVPPPAGLQLTDLAELMLAGVPAPNQIVAGLLYEEGLHWFAGHPGSGKTTLVAYAAHEVMLAGRHVVWLDYESGPKSFARKLLAMGVSPQLVGSNLHYASFPDSGHEALERIAATWPGSLVIFDSASKALSYAGLDENSPSEVTKWATPIVKALKTHHLPVVVIDHVTKTSTGKDRYARGAGSKLADSDVMWRVDAIEPFNATTPGTIRAKLQKDKEGDMPFDLYFRVGDGEHGLPVLPIDAPVAEDDDTADSLPHI